MSSHSVSIGLDLGGTAIKAGTLMDSKPDKTHHCDSPTEYQACIEALAGAARALASQPQRVGLAVPGVLSREEGIVVDAPNLPFLNHKPLRQDLSNALGCPVVFENDASAAALAEGKLGAGKEHPNFLLVTIGTGIGGGLILNGELWTGTGGMAGEFGHLKVGHDRTCRCGAKGCIEAAVSAQHILQWAAEKGCPSNSLPELADRARTGDQQAHSVFKKSGTALGEGLAQVALLLDLRVFLMGGGAAPVLDLLAPSALQALALQSFGRSATDFTLSPASLGNDAGWMGAALI